MIRTIFRFSLLSVLLLSCFGFVLMTRTGDCDMPGLLGIMPGLTTYPYAANIVRNLPQERQIIDEGMGAPGFNVVDGQGNRFNVWVNLYAADKFDASHLILESAGVPISLTKYEAAPIFSLGEFIESGCKPAHVYRSMRFDDPNWMYLLFVFGDDGRMAIRVPVYGVVSPDSPIDLVWLLSVANMPALLEWNFLQNGFQNEIPWLGYAPVGDYWAVEPISSQAAS